MPHVHRDSINIEVIYEDEDLLIVNKPSGLPTQASVDRSRANLYDLLREDGRWTYLGLHHRLDVPTSGLVMLTKNQSINKAAAELFKGRNIQKTYHCLIAANPKLPSAFTVKNHLKAIKGRNGKSLMRSVNVGGDAAETDFVVLETVGERMLIQAQPKTGRMHQIRVHLADKRLPILGDALYGKVAPGISRLMLHATRLEFAHPRTGRAMKIEGAWPADFEKAFKG